MAATIAVKVVPGARHDRVVGRYGDAIKVQVSAPPEGGKANSAVVALVAGMLGVKDYQVTILRGHTQRRKILHIEGIAQSVVDARVAEMSEG